MTTPDPLEPLRKAIFDRARDSLQAQSAHNLTDDIVELISAKLSAQAEQIDALKERIQMLEELEDAP